MKVVLNKNKAFAKRLPSQRIEFHSNVIDSNVDDDTTAHSLAGTMIKTVTEMEKEP